MSYINDEKVLGGIHLHMSEGGAVEIEVDQTYNPESENAQSGKALAPIFDKKVGVWKPNTNYVVGDEVLFIASKALDRAYFYFGKCIESHISPNETEYRPESKYWNYKYLYVSYAKQAIQDINGNDIISTYATKEEVGNIETALDNIIAIQNELIGGESV